jgi:hypothetical protein
MQGPKTVQEAIAQFEAAGEPDRADLMRAMHDSKTFAVLVDRLPHAIETDCAGKVITLLKMWGAWHGFYPVPGAIQAMLHGPVDKDAAPVDSR